MALLIYAGAAITEGSLSDGLVNKSICRATDQQRNLTVIRIDNTTPPVSEKI